MIPTDPVRRADTNWSAGSHSGPDRRRPLQPKPVATGAASDALREIERTDLGRFVGNQGGDATAMLTNLLVSNTLLALSKLGTAGLTLEVFATAVTDAIMQCVPINVCALCIEAPDVPSVLASTDWWPDGAEALLGMGGALQGDQSFQVAGLMLDERTPAGYLGVQGIPGPIQQAGLVNQAAEHISSMLNMLLDGERHRRAVAASTALELIAGINESLTEDDLREIATAIQLLPGAVATSIVIDRPKVTGVTTIDVGKPPTTLPEEYNSPIGRNGSVTIRMWWAHDIQPTDSRFPEIVNCLIAGIDRVEHTAQLLDDMETDELTQLGNRRRASRTLAQTRSRARREGVPYSVLMFDLDKFKSVNDRFGHEVGDRVLRAFAVNLAAVVRSFDIATRWGGEEFLVICPATDEIGCVSVADRILRSTPNACAGAFPVEYRQTVSIGMATAHDQDIDPLQYVKLADLALYEAKSAGRNRYKARRLTSSETDFEASNH